MRMTDLRALNELHRKYDGPVPAEYLDRLMQESQRVWPLTDLRERIRHERETVQHEIARIRRFDAELADPCISARRAERVRGNIGICVMTLELARRRHGKACQKLAGSVG